MMRFSESIELANATPCPRPEDLQAFLQADPSVSSSLSELASHLDGCGKCQALLDGWLQQKRQFSSTAGSLANVVENRLPEAGLLLGASASRFQLRQKLGSGGAGTVYQAWDQLLNREVALKIPHGVFRSGKGLRNRFALEARAMAKLAHPNLVPLFDAIMTEETVLLVSEFVVGPSLEIWLEDPARLGRVPFREAARIVAELADGISTAHLKGVLHRDLKPANILLDVLQPTLELPFTPRIADFGSAFLDDGFSESTESGIVVGSYSYLSPEQALCRRAEYGPPTDIYSLGVILYELLTGRLPLTAESKVQMLRKTVEDEPLPPRRFRHDVPLDLEAICLKCLEKRQSRRYATAAELRDDLRRFLQGEMVLARHPAPWERGMRMVRRYPALSFALAIVVISTLIVILSLRASTTTLQKLNTELQATVHDRDTALQREGELARLADTNRQQAERQLYASLTQQAADALSRNDFWQAKAHLQEASRSNLVAYQGVEFGLMNDWLRLPVQTLYESPSALYAFDWSPDGRILALVGKDAMVRLLAWPECTLIREWPTQQIETNAVRFTHEGKRLWTTGDDGTIRIWQTRDGQQLACHQTEHPPVYDLLPSSKHGLMFSSAADGVIDLWDLDTARPLQTWEHPGSRVRAMILSADQSMLIWGGKFGGLSRCRIPEGAPLGEFSFRFNDIARTFALSEDGRFLIAARRLSGVILFDARDGSPLAEYRTIDEVNQLLFLPGKKGVLIIEKSGVAHRWPIYDHPTLPIPVSSPEIPLNQYAIALVAAGKTYFACLDPAREQILLAGEDKLLKQVAIADLHAGSFETIHLQKVEFAKFSRSQKIIFLYAGQELHAFETSGCKALWKTSQGRDSFIHQLVSVQDGVFHTLEGTREKIHYVAVRYEKDGLLKATLPISQVDDVHHDPQMTRLNRGFYLVQTIEDYSALRLINIDKGEPPDQSRQFEQKVSIVACHPFEDRIAISDDKAVAVYALKKKNAIWEVPVRSKPVALTWSPHGHWLIGMFADRGLQVWDANSGKQISESSGVSVGATSFLFAGDGQTLIIFTGIGRRLSFWRPAWGLKLGELALPSDIKAIYDISSDGRMLVEGDDGNTRRYQKIGR